MARSAGWRCALDSSSPARWSSPTAATTIKTNPNLDLLTTRSMQAMFVGMNSFRRPFDDVRVRQAMNYAINRDEIIEKVLNGYAFRNATSTGALTMGYDPDLEPYSYDPDKAKQLLADAGYANGFDTELDGTIDRYNADREVAEAIVGQLAPVGVRVKYTGAEFNAFVTRFLSDPALPMAGGQRALGPNAFKGLCFLGCGNSTGGDFDLCNRLHFHSQVRGIYYNTPESTPCSTPSARTWTAMRGSKTPSRRSARFSKRHRGSSPTTTSPSFARGKAWSGRPPRRLPRRPGHVVEPVSPRGGAAADDPGATAPAYRYSHSIAITRRPV